MTTIHVISILAGLMLAARELPAKDDLVAPASAVARIVPERSKGHVDLLASDRMMGRDTPSPELDSAAAYIAARFAEYGLDPIDGSYFHEYRLRRDRLGKNNRLSVGTKGFSLKDDFLPYQFSSSGSADGEVVFVGYGVTRPESGYDDYAGIDVTGKIVLAIHGEPPALLDSGRGMNADAQPRAKMWNAAWHGAAGILLIANPAQFRLLQPYVYWPSLEHSRIAIELPYRLDLGDTASSIPTVNIGGDVVRALLKGSSLTPLTQAIDRIDREKRPASFGLGTSVRFEVDVDRDYRTVRNVVGVVRGGLLPEEYVVIGAHYDHVGHAANGSDTVDTIFNGADDNASGTAGLLLAAEGFGSIPPDHRPARSLLFIAFSGEEKGLYGSRAYVADPVVPNNRVVAMLNMDMISRNDPDSISIAGGSRSPELLAIARQANAEEPMTIACNIEELFFRSDQASFAAAGIPVLFFSSGMHPDYHRVSDSPEKVDNGKLAHVARLCFRTAWIISEMTGHPEYIEVDDPNNRFLDH